MSSDDADETETDETDENDGDESESEGQTEAELELESVETQANRVQAAMFTSDRQATERARQNGHGQNGHGTIGAGANGNGKSKKVPMAPAFMREHPLFPQESDAPPREGEFVWIDVARLAPNGEMEHHPRRFSAGELQSWQDIYEICGGGHYRLTATNSRSRFVAFHPAKVGEFHTLGGEPRPFNPESSAKRIVRPGVLPTASEAAAASASAPAAAGAQGVNQKDLATTIAEAVNLAIAARFPPAPVAPPPPPQGPSIAEVVTGVVTALGAIVTPITNAIVNRPAPVQQDMMTPMLKMMEMSSNERVAMITAGKDKPDPTAEMLKVMVQMREKPMTAAELLTLMKSSKDDKQMSPMDWINFAKEMRGGDNKGGLKDTIETIKAVQTITPQGGGTSELGEVAGLFGTLMKATEKGEGAAPAAPAQAPAQKPQTALLIPGMGMVTNPSPALIKRMEDVAAGHAQPGVLAPAQAAPTQPAPVQAAQAAPPPPAPQAPPAIVQAPAAPPAPPPQAAQAPVALPVIAPPSDEDAKLEAAIAAALASDEPLPPEASTLSPADYFAHKIRTDPEFSRRVQEKLEGAQARPPAPPAPPPPPPPAVEPPPPASAAAPMPAAALTADDVIRRIQSDPMFLREVHIKMNEAVAAQAQSAQAAPPAPVQEVPPAEAASPAISISGEMMQEVARQSPELVDSIIAQAVGPEQAKEVGGFAEALASLPPEARPYLQHAFPADGLKAAQEGRLRQ